MGLGGTSEDDNLVGDAEDGTHQVLVDIRVQAIMRAAIVNRVNQSPPAASLFA